MLIFSTLFTEGTRGIHGKVYPEYRENLKDVSAFLKKYGGNPQTCRTHVQITKAIAKGKSKQIEQESPQKNINTPESQFDGF